MNKTALLLCAVFTGGAFFVGCGDNLAGPSSDSETIPSPKSLMAFSVDAASVKLVWSSPGGGADTVLQRYLIRWPGRQDSVEKNVLSYLVDSLAAGEALFEVFSRRTTGELSDPAIIRWAPASRFDSAFVLSEIYQQEPGRLSGFHVGTASSNPFTMSVDLNGLASLDFYLYGGSGQVAQSLSLWSATLFSGAGKPTRFSTVTDSSASLDFPRSAFADEASFTKDSIAVRDNTVYYARILGTNLVVHYARVHVRVRSLQAFPYRSIEIRVSLQRTPNLPYAWRGGQSASVVATNKA